MRDRLYRDHNTHVEETVQEVGSQTLFCVSLLYHVRNAIISRNSLCAHCGVVDLFQSERMQFPTTARLYIILFDHTATAISPTGNA